ncbi:hypothetical protein SARC_16159 [Sphaeroforma arctica JP610]|uniref:MHD2 domain-containing protein n=1 Tax=Sphaeroforma arctica JP610 TaxID=667725 RepID=A0A0L0F3N5_9EUKA|nr:hypothetical protein SARC_16159 [Sphaeroforma arctica JP610]KNC71302.1 hypothetical protein SARC_16159 [Sphaeroforma arctica JP610]|eukprot:XP_014145204.1 hypothetical protein SARC_16159 [Sphaeroforma arctica JP610]
MSEMQYLNVYVRCLNAVWGEILRIVERIVIDEKYDVRRIRALENALESLWACVHAKGNGLPADVLAEERYKILRQVLTAMEANDGESVVNLHMFNQENPKQAAFLKEVMKKSKDKYIQMYLSSIP